MSQQRMIGVLQGLGALALLPWGLLAMFSPMAFDSGFEMSPLTLLIFAIWAYPVVLIGASIASRRYAMRGRMQAALIAVSVPLLYITPILLYLFVESASV